MDFSDSPKITFLSNHANYYYNDMPLGLKNVGATYLWLMDIVLSHHTRRNIEVYVDDMIVKTTKGKNHASDLEDILQSIRSITCAWIQPSVFFGVQAGKFLGYMITKMGIKGNLDKCQAIIYMRRYINIKEVHKLTSHLAALSRFLSCASNKTFLFFFALKKKERFNWTTKSDEVFSKVKSFLTSPPIITLPIEEPPLFLYLSVTDKVMSLVLTQEMDKVKCLCI